MTPQVTGRPCVTCGCMYDEADAVSDHVCSDACLQTMNRVLAKARAADVAWLNRPSVFAAPCRSEWQGHVGSFHSDAQRFSFCHCSCGWANDTLGTTSIVELWWRHVREDKCHPAPPASNPASPSTAPTHERAPG